MFFKMVTISPTLLLSYMYFLQGLPYGLQARFLPIYFRMHGMSLSNIGFIKILFIPWLCKFFWAPFVDHYGNKTIWLTWSMLGLCGTCLLTACIEPHWLLPLCIVLLLLNFLTSTQDIATDGLAIEILTASEIANGNIAQVVGYKVGAIVGGGLLAWLSDWISWGAIFTILTLNYAVAVYVVKTFVPRVKSQGLELTVMEPQESLLSGSDSCTEMMPQSGGAENKDACCTLESASFASSIKNVNKSSVASSCIKNCSDRSQIQSSHACRESSDSCDLPSTANSVNRRGRHWIQDHLSDVLSTEGTSWILVYVLLYKLGEQGALNMMPMFLIDHGMAAADVGIWTGVFGQAASIAGSVVGGMVISSQRCKALDLLKFISVIKVLVLSAEASAVFLLLDNPAAVHTSIGRVPCVMLLLLLLVVSGTTSTAAFTLMMQCSQRASANCQASHYSLLATAEVLGKLLFSVFVGALTDSVGYPMAFAVFVLLSLTVLPLFTYAPRCLLDGFFQRSVDGTTKNH